MKQPDSMNAARPVHPLIVQHNALINARFVLNTTESRLFLALLSRIGRDDTQFQVCRIPVRELMAHSTSNSTYELVRKTLRHFASRTLLIEKLDATARRQTQPDFSILPLLAFAEYKHQEGVVEARFNDLLMPYLLQLRENFTKAQLTELLKLKSSNAYRVYLLLREYAAFGKRVMAVAELKTILGVEEEYDRFTNFRARILDPAQSELAQTDMAFTYVLEKQGRTITHICFLFKPTGAALVPAPAPETSWEATLLEAGVAAKSLAGIKTQLENGYYDEGYIYFVVAHVRRQAAAGKVKKLAGAVYKALLEGYLLEDYRRQLRHGEAGEPGRNPAKPVVAQQERHTLDDVHAMYETMRQRRLIPDESFEQNLARVWLSAGFRQETDAQGIQWLIKP
ncbi:replication initiation protein [Hymenobacter sp. APR13]|uniref:replication initiation protein n=1 Tax=Hymenobacter sp. APR13 TaxID=1356852 RepID=UPI0009DD9177|nr:replication initiation protein [Hymenobacter sp. APR13]